MDHLLAISFQIFYQNNAPDTTKLHLIFNIHYMGVISMSCPIILDGFH